MSLLVKKLGHRGSGIAVPGLPIDWIPITWLPIVLALLVLTTIFASSAAPAQSDSSVSPAQSGNAVPPVGEGCLMYRSAVGGRYEPVPLVHTDVALDVRGLKLRS